MGKYKYLELSIYHVFKGDFNDSYYLETVYIDLNEIQKEELVWIDPYNKYSKINNTFIAIKNYTDEEYVILIKKENEIQELIYPIDFLLICSEDFDKSRLLASHIKFRMNK